ncbi:hypothetical protein [Paenibacillus larvae]|uniref:hypothetical protein n=1 Tax=Paenibacillus larvae TaxID=1464 RepID=UPI00227F04FA|nr:hypothetical protein [Paenibacillus larvae]MCY9746373.1 hypothetical protein [Paenibacillus larvae]MCY9752085.1 hypothetical protein [Paenibacillus larvae]
MTLGIYDPKQGIPATQEELLVFGRQAGAINSIIYFPADRTPHFLQQPEDTIQLNGLQVFPYPELRVFDTAKKNLRGFAQNSVQFHLKYHVLGSIHLVHWLLCCRDEWPQPYITETMINPSDAPDMLPLIAKSKVIILNLYLNGTYYETRAVDNPLQEKAKHILNEVSGINIQNMQSFMRAKRAFEEKTALEYQNFEWTEPLKSIRLNFV